MPLTTGPVTLVSPSLRPSSRVRAGVAVLAAKIGGEWEADRPPRHYALVADVPLVPCRVRIFKESSTRSAAVGKLLQSLKWDRRIAGINTCASR